MLTGMRYFFITLVLGLNLAALPAMAKPTPYYGAGTLGSISVMPLAGSVGYTGYDDDLFARTGMGQGLHGAGVAPAAPSFAAPYTGMMPPANAPIMLAPNSQGFDAPQPTPILSAAAPTRWQNEQNFTFVAPNTAQNFDGFFSQPQGNVQGYDSTLSGSFYGGLSRRDFYGARSPATRRHEIDAALNPPPKPSLPHNQHAEAIKWNPAALYSAQ